jgi:hypothetical protein
LVLAVLCALPFFTYQNTIFARFGLRDDYSVLREVHEEPGKVTAFCASHARPILGWLMEQSFRPLHTIDDLKWGRLLAALCIGLVAAGTAWVLVRQLRWRLTTAALVGGLIVVLPSSQVLVSWAICWGHLVGLLLGIAGFAAAEHGLRGGAAGGPVRWRWLLLGWVCVVAGAVTYQSNALFYTVFLAAALPGLRGLPTRARLQWLGAHLGVIGAGLLGAFLLAKGLFAAGVFPQSERIAFEPDVWGKLGWFVREPLGNALSFIVINDDEGRTALWHLLLTILVAGVIGAGAIGELRRHGRVSGALWNASLLGLPVLAYAVSIIAAERWSTYRTIYALTGVLLVFFVHGLEHVAQRWGRFNRWFAPGVLALFVVAGWVLARQQAYELIAVPQQRELAMIAAAAGRIDPSRHERVFVLTPDADDSCGALTYADEFGSLSTASEWTPKEMLKHVMRERYPAVADVNTRYTLTCEDHCPPAEHFDVTIDLPSQFAALKPEGEMLAAFRPELRDTLAAIQPPRLSVHSAHDLLTWTVDVLSTVAVVLGVLVVALI